MGLESSGERLPLRRQSAAQLIERIRPDAMQLFDVGFAELRELIEMPNTCRIQRASRRSGQFR